MINCTMSYVRENRPKRPRSTLNRLDHRYPDLKSCPQRHHRTVALLNQHPSNAIQIQCTFPIQKYILPISFAFLLVCDASFYDRQLVSSYLGIPHHPGIKLIFCFGGLREAFMRRCIRTSRTTCTSRPIKKYLRLHLSKRNMIRKRH